MKCAHCLTPVPEDATFCHRCGSAVSDAEGQAAATAAMTESHEQQIERMLREETGGEFNVERLLGRGGMALVYLATEIHLDRKVAIKVLPPELTFGHGVERFKREAKTAAALDHPHIIPIHRIASGGKLFWYTMKYVEGRSLEDYLKEHKKLSLNRTIEILEPVADALAYAHEAQVIHRDIKPANVMLDQRNRVTVADFGIAKALTEATLTASGSVIGTPYYMSPEQGMGKPVSGASDQYSVAVMAYRMLSGQVPFDGDSAIDILHKHCKEPPPPLQVLVPNLPRHVYAAIDKALAKEPDRRFSTVTAFVGGLKALSPEISAEMDTVKIDSDRSIQADISTKVIGIRDEQLKSAAAHAEISGAASGPATAGSGTRLRAALIALLAVLMIGAGVVGGLWLSGRQPRGGAPEEEETGVSVAAGNDIPSAVAATPTPPQPTTGTVTVTGLPASGVVTVDGVRQSDTVFVLDPGQYTIGLSAPGQQEVETALTVTAGAQFSVPFFSARAEVTTGTVQVTGLPRGGVILVDGRRQNQTNFELEAGRHAIRLTAPGYTATESEVSVTPGTGLTVQFTGQALVAAVSVRPATSEVVVGREVQIAAQPVDGAGNPLNDRGVRWASRDPSVATVTQRGVVRGVAIGTTVITATAEDQSGSATVSVTAIQVGAVEVSPANSAVFEGESLGLDANVLDEAGRPMVGQPVTWTSGDPSIATVSSTGVVTGVRAGSTRITARAGDRRGSSALTVKPAVVNEQVTPPPRAREISGPGDLFERAAPAGWTLVESTPPEIAKYDSRLGTIRILRAPQGSAEAIIAQLRTVVAGRMTAIEEAAPPSSFATRAGETVLVQVFSAIQGSGFNEARFRIVLAAAKNDSRGIGVIAQFEQYVDPDQGQVDLRELLESLRR